MAERALAEAQAQQQRKLWLEFTKGPLAGTAFEVTSTAVLGREGDVVIADPEISAGTRRSGSWTARSSSTTSSR